VTAAPGGATQTGTGTTTTFNGLTAGTTYTFTVTSAAGCTSPASLTAVINAQPPTPTAPVIGAITQPTCTVATGTITVQPPLGAGDTYSINGTTFQSNPQFTGVPPGLTPDCLEYRRLYLDH
jgi:hypothetical protein